MSNVEASNVETHFKWDDGVAAARRWRKQSDVSSRPMNEALIELAKIRPGMSVLDLASGAGHPALDIARAIGPSGHVIATDLSTKLLEVAKERAVEDGLSNITFRVVDMEDQPFPDAAFDSVTCRLGIMYARDVQRALGEMRRVLKPDGRVALAAWGPAEGDNRKSTVLKVLKKFSKSSSPDPALSQPSSFSEPGKLTRALSQAGFKQVYEETRTIPFPFPGPPEQAWEMAQDSAILFRKMIESLLPEERRMAGLEICEIWKKYYDGHQVLFTAPVVLASGLR